MDLDERKNIKHEVSYEFENVIFLIFITLGAPCVGSLFYLKRFSSIVLRNVWRLQLEVICPEAYKRRIKDIVCTPKPVHTKTTYKVVLNLDTIYYHDVLISRKGPWKSIVPLRPLIWHCKEGQLSPRGKKLLPSLIYILWRTMHIVILTMDYCQQILPYLEQYIWETKIGYIYISIMLITLP